MAFRRSAAGLDMMGDGSPTSPAGSGRARPGSARARGPAVQDVLDMDDEDQRTAPAASARSGMTGGPPTPSFGAFAPAGQPAARGSLLDGGAWATMADRVGAVKLASDGPASAGSGQQPMMARPGSARARARPLAQELVIDHGEDDDLPAAAPPFAASRPTKLQPALSLSPASSVAAAAGSFVAHAQPGAAVRGTSRMFPGSSAGAPMPSSSGAAGPPASADPYASSRAPLAPPSASSSIRQPLALSTSYDRSPAAAVAAASSRTAGAGGTGGGGLVMEDVGDLGFDDHDSGGAALAGPSGTFGRSKGLAGGTPLAPDAARALTPLLWGGQGGPPPSWRQGFYFCGRPGLRFGLVQKQGGPCGILAAVQAHILAALGSSSNAAPAPHSTSSSSSSSSSSSLSTFSFNLDPSNAQQEAALVTALSQALIQAAEPGQPLTLATLPSPTPSSSCDWPALTRLLNVHSIASPDDLPAALRSCLSQYTAPDGWGVVLFLVSLALTHGVARVCHDMDEPSNALMGAHGYCTQELVNLILVGQAVSNVFDGRKRLDASTLLKGVPRRSRLGLLTLFEWYKYVEVGSNYKRPELPIWVVCSESHFTVLFSPDGRAAAADQLPFDLCYYDELANQDKVVRLTLRHDSAGGWTQKVGDSFGDRGRCEGQNIPPLECVIETRWPGVAVDWNGSDVIL